MWPFLEILYSFILFYSRSLAVSVPGPPPTIKTPLAAILLKQVRDLAQKMKIKRDHDQPLMPSPDSATPSPSTKNISQDSQIVPQSQVPYSQESLKDPELLESSSQSSNLVVSLSIERAKAEIETASKRKRENYCQGPPISKYKKIQHERNLEEKRQNALLDESFINEDDLTVEPLDTSFLKDVTDDDIELKIVNLVSKQFVKNEPVTNIPAVDGFAVLLDEDVENDIEITYENIFTPLVKTEGINTPHSSDIELSEGSDSVSTLPSQSHRYSIGIFTKVKTEACHDSEIKQEIKAEPKIKEEPDNSPNQHLQDLHLPYTRFYSVPASSHLQASILKVDQDQKVNLKTKSSKSVKFNPIGTVRFIPYKLSLRFNLNKREEPSRCRKTKSSLNSIRINRKPLKKFTSISSSPYVEDSINPHGNASDPPVISSNVRRSRPKVAINTIDLVCENSKIKTKTANGFPSPAKFSIDFNEHSAEDDDIQVVEDSSLSLGEVENPPLFDTSCMIRFNEKKNRYYLNAPILRTSSSSFGKMNDYQDIPPTSQQAFPSFMFSRKGRDLAYGAEDSLDLSSDWICSDLESSISMKISLSDDSDSLSSLPNTSAENNDKISLLDDSSQHLLNSPQILILIPVFKIDPSGNF